MLAATATDARGSLFPLAFAIVDAETTDNWPWFLRNLRDVLTPRTPELFKQNAIAILSDRHNGLLTAIPIVFPRAAHGFCIKHIERNIRTKFNALSGILIKLLWSGAYTETEEEFLKHMASIGEDSPTVHEWLKKIHPKHWSDAYFPGRRFGHLTSNISESLKSWLNDAHERPNGPMLETIRSHLMRWFDERHKFGGSCQKRAW
jgi:transposase-like protein